MMDTDISQYIKLDIVFPTAFIITDECMLLR